MKYASLSILLFLFIHINTIIAQEKSSGNEDDRQLIENTINMYFDGWMTGDTTKLGQAMHATCYLKFIRDGKVVNISRNEYLSRFKPHAKAANNTGRILAIELTRTAAAATCEIERPDRLFTDYFNLLKVGDQWFIVDKISTSIGKE